MNRRTATILAITAILAATTAAGWKLTTTHSHKTAGWTWDAAR